MIGLIIMGVCAALSFAGKICQALRMHVSVRQVGYIPPAQGFDKLISSSFNGRLQFNVKVVSQVVGVYLQNLDQFLPKDLLNESAEYRRRLQLELDYQSYRWDDNQLATFVVVYNKDDKKFYLYTHNLRAISSENVEFTQTMLEAQFEMPTGFMLMETIKYNAIKSSTVYSLEKIPNEVTPQAILDAISMTLAPAITGDLDVDDTNPLISQLQAIAATISDDELNMTVSSALKSV